MIIYKLTNKVNGKIYIGKTERTIKERLDEHIRHNYIIVDKAIHKYGIDSFVVEIVDSASSLKELDKKEQEWIKNVTAYCRMDIIKHLAVVLPKGFIIGMNLSGK